MNVNIDLNIIDKYKDLFTLEFNTYDYFVLLGGRNSAKSYHAAIKILLFALECSNRRVLCAREYQKSIAESTHSLLSEVINTLGLSEYFTVFNTYIKAFNASEILFAGLRTNVNSLKSINAIDLLVVEEAESVSENSWSTVIPSIRKIDSKIIVIFNPKFETDHTYIYWYETPPPRTLIIKTSYLDNKFISEKSLREINHLKENDYNSYLHVYGGSCLINSSECVFRIEWFNAAIDSHTKLGFKGLGSSVLSFDPAGEGKDTKALAVRTGSIITGLEEWTAGDLVDAVDKVYNTILDTSSKSLVVDGTGIGEGVWGLLEQRIRDKDINVRIFKGSSSVDNPTDKYDGSDTTNENLYKNLRSQAIWELRRRFEATYRAVVHNEYTDPTKLISLDSSKITKNTLEELKKELATVKRDYKSDLIAIESKKHVKKSYGLTDTLAMIFFNRATKEKYNKVAKSRKDRNSTSIC
jgi:phage terminase large subunit